MARYWKEITVDWGESDPPSASSITRRSSRDSTTPRTSCSGSSASRSSRFADRERTLESGGEATETSAARRLYVVNHPEVGLLVMIVFVASFMARGFGLRSAAAGFRALRATKAKTAIFSQNIGEER